MVQVRYKQGLWFCWVCDEYYDIRTTYYKFPDGAYKQMEKEIEHAAYRIKARTTLIPHINYKTLQVAEMNFINKLIRLNCRGINKKQYGYLKGIWERNRK